MFLRPQKQPRGGANFGAFLALMHGDKAAYGRLAGGTTFGQSGGVIWPYVSVAEIDDLDAKVRNLDTDVDKLSAGPAPVNFPSVAWNEWQERSLAMNAWKWSWAAWRLEWTTWKEDHYGEWARLGDEPRAEFDGFVAEYNERLRSFTDDWGPAASKATPKTPAGKEAAKGWDALADTIKWAVVLVAGVMIYKEVKG